MVLNLFELSLSPPINKVYATNNPSLQMLSSIQLFVKSSKDTVISLEALESSRPLVTGIETYVLWLIREHLFNEIEKSELFFDVNRKVGSFAILEERLYRDNYASILRNVTLRFYYLKNRFFVCV